MTTDKKPLLLIVDDEKTQRDGLRAILEEQYDVYVAEDSESAISLMETEYVDVLLTDYKMPKEDGLALIVRAKNLPKSPICILMTAYGSEDIAVEAMKHGADDYISKGGMLLEDLEKKISRALKIQKLEAENADLRRRLDKKFRLESIVGESPAMQGLLEIVNQVAPSSANILITGESGTGKELIAKAIHQLSNRANNALVIVHCAGLSPNLLESELFGHEKGAFTGAHERRIGRFEQANGGTIFLDEIGEIDGATQVKLLRILGERTFERVGSNRTLKTDVRLVAATNKDLKRLVLEGSFRVDLYYRLCVVEIMLPPLRERSTDIPALALKFLQEFAGQNNKKVDEYTPEALECLIQFDWPGNVRELRAAVEHAVVFSTGKQITVSDLPAAIRTPPLSGNPFEKLGGPLSVANNEKQLIVQALKKTKGNKTEAAGLLGMSRRTLHRRIARLEIDR
ncbi:MAG: Transcriptional regulatory protein ZraR [Verrucomicrobia subdivision 3 bacterium]|nr:Transcriptional regulatory protein ZraR [Limisphaerales bacterium]MCS1414686.1 Transcriptional regulatory protein ZraR [Limisphaerales bacterium]